MNKTILIYCILLFTRLSLNSYAQDIFSYSKKIGENDYSKIRELNISVYNNDILSYNFKKKLIPYQSIPEINVLKNGNLVLTYSQEGLVEFFSGSKLLSAHHFYKTHQQNEQILLAAITNKDVIILVSEKNTNIIYTLDLVGNLLDSTNINSGIVSGLASSDNGEFVAVSIYSWEADTIINSSLFLNGNKNIFFQIDEKFDRGIFDSESNQFLGYTNKSSFCLDIVNHNLLWKEKLLTDEIYLTGIFENKHAVFIKGSTPIFKENKWTYPNLSVVSKDMLGNVKTLNKTNSETTASGFSKKNDKTFVNFDKQSIELKLDEKTN